MMTEKELEEYRLDKKINNIISFLPVLVFIIWLILYYINESK